MCEANAYLVCENREELVMESVDTVQPGPDGLMIRNIYGEQKFLKAAIDSLALVDHKILLRML